MRRRLKRSPAPERNRTNLLHWSGLRAEQQWMDLSALGFLDVHNGPPHCHHSLGQPYEYLRSPWIWPLRWNTGQWTLSQIGDSTLWGLFTLHIQSYLTLMRAVNVVCEWSNFDESNSGYCSTICYILYESLKFAIVHIFNSEAGSGISGRCLMFHLLFNCRLEMSPSFTPPSNHCFQQSCPHLFCHNYLLLVATWVFTYADIPRFWWYLGDNKL